MMIIQQQEWHDFNRLMYVTHKGSVQADLFRKPAKFGGWKAKGTAFIYALWVNEEHRRRGIAGKLLDFIETAIKRKGHKSVFLEWASKDTPVEILEWYKRRGYCECEGVVDDNGEEIILLEKKL